MSSRSIRCIAVALVTIALTFSHAHPVLASGQALKRSGQNIIQAPLDLVFAPFWASYTGGRAMWDMISKTPDFTPMMIMHPIVVPAGFSAVTGLCMFVNTVGSSGRLLEGLVYLPAGLVLLPTDKEVKPVYEHVLGVRSVVDHETKVFHFDFGVNYCSNL